MKKSTKFRDRFITYNLGWLDRLMRFMIGAAILAGFFTALVIYSDPVWLAGGTDVPWWTYYTPALSIYFLLTAVLGTDPMYRLFNVRSCGTSARNPCGTFPFEIDAAMGHKPVPDSHLEHSLETSHHRKPSALDEHLNVKSSN